MVFVEFRERADAGVMLAALLCVPCWEYCSQVITFASPLPSPQRYSGEEYCEIRPLPTALLLG